MNCMIKSDLTLSNILLIDLVVSFSNQYVAANIAINIANTTARIDMKKINPINLLSVA